jgi:hypothetical protein
LWGVLPQANMQAPWALVAVPAVPALLALVCFISARSTSSPAGFDNLRAQVQADMALLTEAGAA